MKGIPIFGVTLVVFGAVGCGGDEESAPAPTRPVAAAPGARAGAAAGTKTEGFRTFPRVEDRVPAGERAGLRHNFRETDFQPDATGNERRDPFRSYVLRKSALPAEKRMTSPSDQCSPKQMIAANYSMRDIKLVGIVATGPTKRYALFQDTANVGHKVLIGDCLGTEKAWVKMIGERTVTLEIAPEANVARASEERSIELFPEELRPTKIEDDETGRGTTRRGGADSTAPPEKKP